MGWKIPGCQASSLKKGKNRRKTTKRFVLWKNLKQCFKFLCRDNCLNPKDVVYNWPTRKDLPGTKKIQLPIIVVTPPDQTTTKSVFNRKKRSRKPYHSVDAPPKLVLDPSFWSPQPETQRARKKRILLQCRNSACKERFSTFKDREMHEGFCLSFEKVSILYLVVPHVNIIII